jgi:uncharacterized cupin superfamily protein
MGSHWRTRGDADVWEPMELGGAVVGEVHWLRAEEGSRSYYAGFWRVTGEPPSAFDYAFEQNETIHVLEGEVTIELDGGPRLALRPGDAASFAPGGRSTWQVVRTPFKELFVLS